MRESAVPWSIVRAPGFYWLLERMLSKMARKPLLLLPAGVRMQPLDSDEVAMTVAAAVPEGQRGERRDFAGSQTLTMLQKIRSRSRMKALCPCHSSTPKASSKWSVSVYGG